MAKNVSLFSCKIVAAFKEYQMDMGEKAPKLISAPVFSDAEPVGFFDGATQMGQCGAGMVIKFRSNLCTYLDGLW